MSNEQLVTRRTRSFNTILVCINKRLYECLKLLKRGYL
jgi:hypothetical protein